MMKQFGCGEVVPGCDARFEAETEEDLLAQVAQHAKDAHQMETVPPELVDQVKEKIREV